MSNKISETTFLVRCPNRMREQLTAFAIRSGKPRSQILRDLIAAALGHDDDGRRPPPAALAA